MEWYRISSLHAGMVDVQAENWLAAFGIGLGKLGKVADLAGIACETLPNGRILVRNVRTGEGYAVFPLARDESPDEPSEEATRPVTLEEVILAPVGLADYLAEVAAATDADRAIRRALGALKELAPSEAGSVLRRHTDGWLGFEGSFGPGADRLAGVVIPPGTGVAGFSVAQGMGVVLRDAYADPRFFRQVDRYTGFVTKSILCAPLYAAGTTYGCIELINSLAPSGFNHDAIGMTERVARALAERLSKEPIPTPPNAR